MRLTRDVVLMCVRGGGIRHRLASVLLGSGYRTAFIHSQGGRLPDLQTPPRAVVADAEDGELRSILQRIRDRGWTAPLVLVRSRRSQEPEPQPAADAVVGPSPTIDELERVLGIEMPQAA